MLDLEVKPHKSLGNEQWQFILGMPFNQAVSILKKQDRLIKGVQVWYSDQNPLLTDLVLNLSQDGIRLIFDSHTQRLKIIEVYNMTKVKLKYCGSHFNSGTVRPTSDQIEICFGFSQPGNYIKEKQIFVLTFRGVSFEFKIDARLEPSYRHEIGSTGSIQFPNGTSPFVSRMYIYSGNSVEEARTPELELECFYGNCFLEALEVERQGGATKALRFTIVTEGNGPAKLSELRKVTLEKVVSFGDTSEDVASLLGCPSKVFYKAEDKMKIHSPDAHKLVKSQCSDYFFNYSTLGVDILFDATVHRVKKFILHTNYPGHYDFNTYYRCAFKIPLVVDKPTEGVAKHNKATNLSITYETKWENIKSALISSSSKPVVLNRAASTNTTNPFGRTFCYGVQDAIFEVMHNGHIASVTFYKQKSSI